MAFSQDFEIYSWLLLAFCFVAWVLWCVTMYLTVLLLGVVYILQNLCWVCVCNLTSWIVKSESIIMQSNFLYMNILEVSLLCFVCLCDVLVCWLYVGRCISYVAVKSSYLLISVWKPVFMWLCAIVFYRCTIVLLDCDM